MRLICSFLLAYLSVASVYSQSLPYLPTSTSGQVVKHTHYTLSYVDEYEQAEWVAYELTRREVQGDRDRTDNFSADPKVRTGSPDGNDYRRSGYDRGHLAPAADMRFSQTAMEESFYMSNMSPQKPGFNRGIWKELEGWVRDKAEEKGSLYVISGGILAGNLEYIGEDIKIAVPNFFYKVLLYHDQQAETVSATAFLLPNRKSNAELSAFVVPIDEIEEASGIDFFARLPDAVEQEMESLANRDGWFNSRSNAVPLNPSFASENKGKAADHSSDRKPVDVNLPSMEMPSVETPGMEMPDVEMPSMEMPGVDDVTIPNEIFGYSIKDPINRTVVIILTLVLALLFIRWLYAKFF